MMGTPVYIEEQLHIREHAPFAVQQTDAGCLLSSEQLPVQHVHGRSPSGEVVLPKSDEGTIEAAGSKVIDSSQHHEPYRDIAQLLVRSLKGEPG